MISDPVSGILKACAKLKAYGEQPNTILMNPAVARFRDVRGTVKQRKAARFWNKKRLQFFKSIGLEVRIEKL